MPRRPRILGAVNQAGTGVSAPAIGKKHSRHTRRVHEVVSGPEFIVRHDRVACRAGTQRFRRPEESSTLHVRAVACLAPEAPVVL